MRQVIPETHPEYDTTRIIERPDGFYWQSLDGRDEFGPFATLLAAMEHVDLEDEDALEPGETLREAEDEIGIAEWIDPATGEPAEEERPRIEEY